MAIEIKTIEIKHVKHGNPIGVMTRAIWTTSPSAPSDWHDGGDSGRRNTRRLGEGSQGRGMASTCWQLEAR